MDNYLPEVTIDKLVHGGQGLGTLADGKKIFVWNALPGEKLAVRLLRSKKGYAEAIAEKVITASADRCEPLEPASYLATSPWQMMNFAAENRYKKVIIEETFAREKVVLPSFEFVAGDQETAYRNKMEFGLWGDEDGIHLAHFVRGSHGKTKVSGSVLAAPAINQAAQAVLAELNTRQVRAGDIKSLMVRSNQDGRAVVALFVKRQDFPRLKQPDEVQGLVVYFSNPKSPASVPTKLLYAIGDRELSDKVLDTSLGYDVVSFFQVNIPVFNLAAQRIADWTRDGKNIVDMYSGVGSIGLSIGGTKVLVDSDATNIAMAKKNIGEQAIEAVEASAEKSLEYITDDATIIADPPRAGFHSDFTERIIAVKPRQVVYLSCNPSTQARDIRLLVDAGYQLTDFVGYNFFPRTPHIETLARLQLL